MKTIATIAMLLLMPPIAITSRAIAMAGTLPPCSNGSLSLSIRTAGVAAGSTYYTLKLRNKTDDACTLYGFPGVSFVGKHGHQVGRAASRDRSQHPATVILLPGAHAVSQLQVTSAANYPPASCKPVRVRRLQVYPPGFTDSLHVRLVTEACSRRVPVGSQLSTGPETPGDHGTEGPARP